MKTQITMLLVVGMVVALAGTAQADMFVVATGVTDSGDIGTWGATFDNVIDGAGLSTSVATGDIVPGTLPTANRQGGTGGDGTFGRWNTPSGTIGTLIFDLGGAHYVSGMLFWNYAEASNSSGVEYNERGLTNLDIEVSTDGTNFTKIVDDYAPGLAVEDGNAAKAATLKTWTPQANITHIRFSDIAGTETQTGFNEVIFTEIPEPATMSLLALGGLGILARRRRR
ncbi:MAG: PEP-CTERM sorting domain-containing protein [bacterium]|nr:PEP-CTERM sorting domain-containing protein [bacterium]